MLIKRCALSARRCGLGLLLLGLVAASRAQSIASPDVERAQREQIEQWQREARRPAELPPTAEGADWLPPIQGEQPCVVLRSISVDAVADASETAPPPAPTELAAASEGYLATCIGLRSLQRLQTNLQAKLQALGFITSTIELPEQDLQSGALSFRLRWGRIGQVRIQPGGSTAARSSAPSSNAMSLQTGQVLNLRDLEHTLENLARLPSQTSRFAIEPGADPYTSDVRIVVSPQARWRAKLGVDGADETGHAIWEAQAQAWLDAPFNLSDQLMLSASGSPEPASEQEAKRHSVYAQWSVPWRRHLFTVSASMSRNSRSIAGGVGQFSEHGREDQAALRWQWTPWRGPDWRTQLWVAWSERRSHSHIDEVELLSRRRVASELSIGGAHWRRLGCGEASVEIDATQTRRLARVRDFQSLDAPMPGHWLVRADWRCAWSQAKPASSGSAATPPWTWAISAWTQAVERPFDGTDLLTLGSRYTVRAQGSAQALQGRRISVARLSATAPGRQSAIGLSWQPWLGWDLGRVERPVQALLPSAQGARSRQALVVGLRWQLLGASGEVSLAQGIGASSTQHQRHIRAQAAWWF